MQQSTPLNKELYDICKQKISKITETRYHWDSQKELQELKNRNEDNQYIELLWRMCEGHSSKNIELQNPNMLEIMKIIQQSETLCARVIYAFEKGKKFAEKESLELKNQLKETYEELKKSSKVYESYKRLNSIGREYGDRYLEDIGMIKKNNSNYNYYFPQQKKGQIQSEGQNETLKQNRRYYYYQKIKNIDELHKKQGNYTYLEDAHDYIQHMFPNHYRSNFNSSAQPLGFLEAQKFRESKVIGFKLLQSVCIFFDFLGLQINKDNFDLEVKQKGRNYNALYKYTHNHLRLRRILACLSVTGFRPIALHLLNTLKQHKNSMQWRQYGQEAKFFKGALRLCFNPEQKFPDSHVILKEHFPNFLNPIITQQSKNNKDSISQDSSSSREEDSYFPSSSQPLSSNTEKLKSNISKDKSEEMKKQNEQQIIADESEMVDESKQIKPQIHQIKISKQQQLKGQISKQIATKQTTPKIEVQPSKVTDQQSLLIEKKRTDSTQQ